MKKVFLSLAITLGVFAAASAQTPVATGPAITVDKDVHDYGDVPFAGDGTCEFKVTNTGTEPLILSKCKGSCGCTVPMWPKDPIAPGASGEIKVKFNSKNKKGNNQKKVTLISNTDPVTTVLTITAQVQ